MKIRHKSTLRLECYLSTIYLQLQVESNNPIHTCKKDKSECYLKARNLLSQKMRLRTEGKIHCNLSLKELENNRQNAMETC